MPTHKSHNGHVCVCVCLSACVRECVRVIKIVLKGRQSGIRHIGTADGRPAGRQVCLEALEDVPHGATALSSLVCYHIRKGVADSKTCRLRGRYFNHRIKLIPHVNTTLAWPYHPCVTSLAMMRLQTYITHPHTQAHTHQYTPPYPQPHSLG